MKNPEILLLKTLLLSTSGSNIYRYSKDKKKRRRIVAGYIGMACLYAMLVGYSVATGIGYGMIGITDAIPGICALVLCLLAFVFTIFKTNGYLFNFREYDMLMSLPFEAKTIAGCKFLYMYIKSLPWYLSISLAMLISYGWFARPFIAVYPVWILLTLFLPLIPMLAAAFLGFLIARISAGFRKTNIVQTVLTMAFIIFCFSLRYIIEALVRDDQVQATMESIYDLTKKASRICFPAGWFADAVTKGSIISGLLLAGVSILLFAAVFRIVGASYRNINSALRSHAAAKRFKMAPQKKRSAVFAIAFKEFRRMTGSTTYMTNAGIGVILAALIGIITLIFGFDRIVAVVTQGAPIDPRILQPAIPLFVYFFIGMVASTACSPSLEGKNYWILQSLPITKKQIYQGKMLFNMLLTVPFMSFAVLCICFSAGVSVIDTVLYLLLGVSLCAFSTAWGCVCGIRHMRLDWENEIEVIKQGAAVAIYMLPNMFAVMGLIVLAVILGMHFSHALLSLILTAIALLLAGLSYLRVLSLAKRA